MGLGEAGEDRRQEGAGIIVGRADADMALHRLGVEGRQRLAVGADDAAGMVEQDLAVRRQEMPRPSRSNSAAAERLLEPLDLHAHRRLGAVHALGRER